MELKNIICVSEAKKMWHGKTVQPSKRCSSLSVRTFHEVVQQVYVWRVNRKNSVSFVFTSPLEYSISWLDKHGSVIQFIGGGRSRVYSGNLDIECELMPLEQEYDDDNPSALVSGCSVGKKPKAFYRTKEELFD